MKSFSPSGSALVVEQAATATISTTATMPAAMRRNSLGKGLMLLSGCFSILLFGYRFVCVSCRTGAADGC